jgi:hypothetical protein
MVRVRHLIHPSIERMVAKSGYQRHWSVLMWHAHLARVFTVETRVPHRGIGVKILRFSIDKFPNALPSQ